MKRNVFFKIPPCARVFAVIALAKTLVLMSCGGGKKEAASGAGAPAAEAAKDAVPTGGGPGGVSPASDFNYRLNTAGTGVIITKYKGTNGKVVIPEEIEGFPVVGFDGEDAGGGSTRFVFQGSAATSVTFPDSLLPFFFEKDNEMGRDVAVALFVGAGKLTEVIFPQGITRIADDMFKGCSALKSFTIPGTVTTIGGSAFGESGLTSMVIPEGVTVIGGYAFAYCRDLKSITLPESLQRIHWSAFLNCSNLETVKLPSHKIVYASGGDWDIGEESTSFRGCTKLGLAAQKAIRDTGYRGSFK
jgi:hypothetical protein